jgi:hypothetical protein
MKKPFRCGAYAQLVTLSLSFVTVFASRASDESNRVTAIRVSTAGRTVKAQAGVSDPKLRSAPKLSSGEVAKPARALEVIRYARTDRLLASFEENIWSQRFRCSGCHSPKGSENAKLVAEHGK